MLERCMWNCGIQCRINCLVVEKKLMKALKCNTLGASVILYSNMKAPSVLYACIYIHCPVHVCACVQIKSKLSMYIYADRYGKVYGSLAKPQL